MPNNRSRRRKRNKSSPLVESSPKKSKSQKSDIVKDTNIQESDRESESNQDSDSDTISQFQPQSTSEGLDPAYISLPITPPSPSMQDGQDYVQHSQHSQQPHDFSQGTAFDSQPPIMNPMTGMMSYQQSFMPEHSIPGHSVMSGHSSGVMSTVTEYDLIKVAQIVKSMLQQEISDQVQKQVDDATKSLKTELTHAKTELEQTKSDLSDLRADHESLRTEVVALQNKQDETEQYSRRMCLRISGIKETKNEDVTLKVLEFAKAVNAKIMPADIDCAHRVGPSSTVINDDELGVFDDGTTGDHSEQREARGREIIIKFTNSSARLNLLKGRSVLRDRNMKSFFINEDLTPTRKKLAFECRRIKRIKNSKINKTWIYAGYPHILDTAGNKIRITCLSDLEVYDVKQGAQPMNTNHTG